MMPPGSTRPPANMTAGRRSRNPESMLVEFPTKSGHEQGLPEVGQFLQALAQTGKDLQAGQAAVADHNARHNPPP